VSVERNFFELGANSTLIVKAYHRLRDLIDHTFPLITMFRYPTTRSLARCIGGETNTEDRVTSKARAAKRKQRFNAARRQRKERN
ncbi:MAG: phosphopantetheine-binding protein, partial [Gammaproteobacteria bacterium]